MIKRDRLYTIKKYMHKANDIICDILFFVVALALVIIMCSGIYTIAMSFFK